MVASAHTPSALERTRHLLRAGLAADAESYCRSVLNQRPLDEEAHLALAWARARQGHVAEAEELLSRLRSVARDVVAVETCIGEVSLSASDLDAARTAFERAASTATAPRAAWIGLARVARRAGRPADALPWLERALAQDRRDPVALAERGWARLALGAHAEAATDFRRARASAGDDPSATAGLARALALQGEHAAAARLLDAELERRPDSALLRWTRADLAFECGDDGVGERELSRAAVARLEELDQPEALADRLLSIGALGPAERVLRHSIAVSRAPRSCVVLAKLLWQQGREQEAVGLLREARTRGPDDPETLLTIASVLFERMGPESALPLIERARLSDPDSHDALVLLSRVRLRQREPAEALQLLRRALSAEPDHRTTRLEALWLGLGRADWSDWSNAAPLVDGAPFEVRGQLPLPGPIGAYLMVGESPERQREAAEATIALFSRGAPLPRRNRPARPTLRVGYLSCDFREHPVARVVRGVLEAHDRQRYRVYGFSVGASDGSATRAAAAAACDEFVDCGEASEEMLARRIHEREVDILVDLTGHTSGSRALAALAMRPAPVQVNWLGYPGTSGATFVDYLVADDLVVPPGAEAGYTERIVRLPETFFPQDRPAEPPPVVGRREFGLPAEALVLCSFNAIQKLTPPVFAVWMSLLRAWPDALLWLYAPPEAREPLAHEAARCGVGEQQIVFAEREPEHSRHLARYGCADLALDTYPYGSHTTASDALYMGCPLVSATGRTFASRVAGSLLRAVGAAELSVAGLAGYAERIHSLVGDRSGLARLRARLIAARTTSPLFDAVRFTRHLEAAYELMWARSRDGVAPDHIRVPCADARSPVSPSR